MNKTLQSIFHSLHTTIAKPLQNLFSRATIDQATLTELERILIQADVGISTTKHLVASVKKAAAQKNTQTPEPTLLLKEALLTTLTKNSYSESNRNIYLLVGVNGSGKTTFASKLAQRYINQGKRVLLIAADTFRSAAQEQLTLWAQQCGAEIFVGEPNQDPSAVIFGGCKKFIDGNYDIMIVDTAGRLQTKNNLMRELEKIRRVLGKQLPNQSITTLLTIDGMLGQNSLEQAKLFHESTPLSGIVLTKMDGSGKGGIIFAISDTLNIPIVYLTFGEGISALELFNPEQFVSQVLGL